MQSTQKTNPYLMGKIVPYPIIDLQEQYLVSVSENGRGMLHTIKHNSRQIHKVSTKLQKKRTMKSKHIDYDSNPINFEEIAKFKVSE